MRYPRPTLTRSAATGAAMVALAALAAPALAQADEAHGQELLQAMSDYLGAQPALAFDFDVSLEVVTVDDQRLAIASSGAVTLNRRTGCGRGAPAALPMSRWSSTARR